MFKDSRLELDKLKNKTGLPLSYDKTINGWQLVLLLDKGGEADISRIKTTNKYFFRMLESMNNLFDELDRKQINDTTEEKLRYEYSLNKNSLGRSQLYKLIDSLIKSNDSLIETMEEISNKQDREADKNDYRDDYN